MPVLLQAPRRTEPQGAPDTRPRKAALPRWHEQLGQRSHCLYQVQRAQRQSPAYGVRYVPEEHPQRAALRGDGMVLARSQRCTAPLRRAVLWRTDFQLLVISTILIRPEARRARLRREPKSKVSLRSASATIAEDR